MQRMPKTKEGLSFHDVGKEVIVYDSEQEMAYCLNPTAAQVIKLCDGETSLQDARTRLEPSPAADDLLSLSLRVLSSNKLLADSPVSTMDRREFLAKWGKVAIALPLVAMISAPLPAAAQSGGGGGGAPDPGVQGSGDASGNPGSPENAPDPSTGDDVGADGDPIGPPGPPDVP